MQVKKGHIEGELLSHLERLLMQGSKGMRCVMIQLTDIEKKIALMKPMFFNTVSSFIKGDNVKCYLCDDGDAFIIASADSCREIDTLHKHIAILFGHTSLEERFRVYDLGHDISFLLVYMEEKIKAISEQEDKCKNPSLFNKIKKKHEAIMNMCFDNKVLSTLNDRKRRRAKLEILLVEDDRFSCKLAKSSLDGDYTIHTANDGESAIKEYVLHAPDIVFLDIDLPDISGQEVLEKITGLDSHSYIVMLSGKGSKINIIKSLRKGAKGFVGKPFARESLIEYIQKFQSVQCL